MDLKLFLHMTITKSGNRSLVIWSSFYNDSILMCWHVSNVFFTPLYKGVKTCCLETQDSHNNFTTAKTLLKLFHIKVHLEFLNIFSELSLEVQGGHDYFRFVEGTYIIALCLSSIFLSIFIGCI